MKFIFKKERKKKSSSVINTLYISPSSFSSLIELLVQGRGGKKVKATRSAFCSFLEPEPKEAGSCCTIALQ